MDNKAIHNSSAYNPAPGPSVRWLADGVAYTALEKPAKKKVFTDVRKWLKANDLSVQVRRTGVVLLPAVAASAGVKPSAAPKRRRARALAKRCG